jgi:site-specific DNA recombinase
MKYYIYCRKSSEDDSRQVQSIDDQKRILKEIASTKGLTVAKVFSESASAKKPGRKVFNEMIEGIHQGKAQGILCWKLDRLARNPICGGTISWMLQQNVIQHIITPEREYRPTDNVLMMAVELGMANQFIRDLSANVKRGTKSKCEKGWFPEKAPHGYKNNLEDHTIIPDPERWDAVRKMWDLMLTGNYSPPKIMTIANNEWGFRTRRGKKSGDKPISRSSIYSMFKNPFYYGVFTIKGVSYEGKHQPMITKEEFDRVQGFLSKKNNTRASSHSFAYTGLIKCGECGCMVTAEKRTKKNKTNEKVHHFTYYHCTFRRDQLRPAPCSQRRYISEKNIEQQIGGILERISISDEFHEWAIKRLGKANERERQAQNKKLESLERTHKSILEKLDNLLALKISPQNKDGELLDDNEFKAQKDKLVQEKHSLEYEMNNADQRIDDWIETLEKVFDFSKQCRERFEQGNIEEKKTILRIIGDSFTLKDGQISYQLKKPFVVIEKGLNRIQKENNKAFEPEKALSQKGASCSLDKSRFLWQAQKDLNPH